MLVTFDDDDAGFREWCDQHEGWVVDHAARAGRPTRDARYAALHRESCGQLWQERGNHTRLYAKTCSTNLAELVDDWSGRGIDLTQRVTDSSGYLVSGPCKTCKPLDDPA